MNKKELIENAKGYVKVVGVTAGILILAKKTYDACAAFWKKYKSYSEDDTLEDIFVEE